MEQSESDSRRGRASVIRRHCNCRHCLAISVLHCAPLGLRSTKFRLVSGQTASMSIHSALQQSLSPNPADRRAAERELDVLKAAPGFSQLALQLAQDGSTSGPIRQAAALLFKNYVRAGWAIVRRLLQEKERERELHAKNRVRRTMKIRQLFQCQKQTVQHSRPASYPS